MKKRLKTLPLLLTIIMAAMAPMDTIMATCIKDIRSSRDYAGPYIDNEGRGTAVGAVAGGAVFIAIEGTAMGLGGVVGGAGLVTAGLVTTQEISEKSKELSSRQAYALEVLYQAQEGFLGPELVSFIKLVINEIGRDKSAILPSKRDIIDILNTGNINLSLCENVDGEFFRPEKSDLLKVVLENL